MHQSCSVSQTCCAALMFLGGMAAVPVVAQKKEPAAAQLPEELRGAKIYRLPEERKPGEAPENPVIYKNISYQDINFERLVLNLFLSVKPVERSAAIRKIYFQDVRVNNVPVHIETFEQEFQVSKKEAIDLPAPLQCAVVFSDLESMAPVKEIVTQDKIRITGQSFIEVKLNAVEKIALRSKRIVLPVTLNEETPLQMFSGSPFLQMATLKVLETLSDPSSAAALALGKEHLLKLAADRALASTGRASLYFLYCEYALRDPKTQAEERFSQSGTGFVVSTDGKLMTAKRVIQPWKFDPQIVFLMNRLRLELVPQAYKVLAWPAGTQVLSPDGQPDSQTAFSTEKETLRMLKTAPDRMEKHDYQDPDSGEKASLSLHAPGENDAALLQLVGKDFHPLAFADPSAQVGADLKTALFGFPFGLSQTYANPQAIFVKAATEGALISLEHQLNPGEYGAPLLTAEGKVLAFSGGTNECIPSRVARTFLQ